VKAAAECNLNGFEIVTLLREIILHKLLVKPKPIIAGLNVRLQRRKAKTNAI